MQTDTAASRAMLWHERHDAPTFARHDPRPRMLVVEDDPVQALLLTLMLERLNVAVTLATDGLQAVHAVQAQRYDLVLMDYRMPTLDGIEATRRIRAWERSARRLPTPIVAVTASVMVDERSRYTEAGMDEVVQKPFSVEKLSQLVARHGARAALAPSFITQGVPS
ncbi:MAG TPA: response regulator [Rhizobacter sp.]|nr:response regulator [Rhizobacter sp.]